MKYCALITAALLAGALTGCAGGSATRSRTTVPAGPVSTGTTSLDLIPSGSTLVIRANEAISADTATAGRMYSAELAEDVVNANGQVLVPRGSPAQLTVVDASRGGAIGSSQLELALSSVNVGGRTYTVQSDVVEERGGEGLGANERTARNVGGGAALGAVIGAIAGGGSGAAAGAAIGAAGGAAAQVLTRGERVRIPAESVLTFRIDRPIHLR